MTFSDISATTARAKIDAYATAVESCPHNLLSARGLAELRTRHIPESRAFAGLLPRETKRLLDIGSGGGLPGMVIAITRPDIDVHLLDATTKKVEFLQGIAQELKVPVTTHHARAEDPGMRSLHGTFDVVTARAVAPLDRLLSITVPFLRTGGCVFAIKGARWREELDQATPQLACLRATVVATPDDQRFQADSEPGVVIVQRVA